jgi:NADPH:quinone reductase-like Zn-dependent oxidoreductase
MKAAIKERYGGPDVVRVEEDARPVPVGDQVLVRVVAASVNRADLDGIYPKPQFVRLFIGLRRPRDRAVGLDVAGVVEAVGPDVTRFKRGHRVFADLYPFRAGAFAEYACASERAFQFTGDHLSFEDAATLPHAATLAIQGLRLRDGRAPGPGDKVLIVGASGNVGPFLVQIAKHLGAEVTGVARGDKLDLVTALGADHVIDYTAVDYTRAGVRYDWIVDVDAHHSIVSVRRALRPDGVYITMGGSGLRIIESLVVGGLVTLASRRWMGLLFWWRPFAAVDVERLKALVTSGVVRPVIDRRYPLSEVVDALRWVDDGHARGKVLVIP